MGDDGVKSSREVVGDFLNSLDAAKSIDRKTLAVVRDLFSTGKLTKTRLLGKLADARESERPDQQGPSKQ